jgi:hypothetical protein
MMAVRMAAIRNSLVIAIVALLIGGASLVGAWETWLHLLLDRGMTEVMENFARESGLDEEFASAMRDEMEVLVGADLASYGVKMDFPPFPNPFAIPRYLHKMLAPEGVWEVRGTTVKGLVLELIWLAEALILLFLPAFVCVGAAADSVFDEVTGQWLSKDEKVELLEPIADLTAMKTAIERGDFSPVAALRALPSGATTYTRLELLWNPGETAFAIRLKEVTVTRTKDGETKSDKTLIPAMLVSAEQFALAKRAGSTKFGAEEMPAPGSV